MSATLTDLHQAILAALRDQFTGRVDTIAHYAPLGSDPIDTPALLLELEEADEGDDIGDGRMPLRGRWAIHCVLSLHTPEVALSVREMAAEVMTLVRRNGWGMGPSIGRPKGLHMAPGDMRPGQAGYESWVVSWEQTLYLVASLWDGTGITPSKVFLGIAPDIGLGHEPDYVEVSGG